MMKLLATLISATIAGGPVTIESWVWGSDIPVIVYTNNADMVSPVEYKDYGFIQLATEHESRQLSVVLVKRPPGYMYPSNEKFCSSLLPAAVAEHMATTGVTDIQSVSIHIDAYPYRAACKCYFRLLVSMGMNRVGLGSGVVVPPSQEDEFCDYDQVHLIGRPVEEGSSGHSPVTPTLARDIQKLRRSAHYNYIDRSKKQLTVS